MNHCRSRSVDACLATLVALDSVAQCKKTRLNNGTDKRHICVFLQAFKSAFQKANRKSTLNRLAGQLPLNSSLPATTSNTRTFSPSCQQQQQQKPRRVRRLSSPPFSPGERVFPVSGISGLTHSQTTPIHSTRLDWLTV